jgi:hypothetical protein
VASGFNEARIGRTHESTKSDLHVTVKPTVENILRIGNFTTEKDSPGIPLDPEVLLDRETFKAHWVEIEFATLDGKHNISSHDL